MQDLTKQLLANYAARVKSTVEDIPTENDQLWSYRQAIAVLHCFDPTSLNPVNPRCKHPNPRVLLHEDIMFLSGGREQGLYTVKPVARKEFLKRMGSREEMLKALSVNTPFSTSLQTAWEKYLNTGKIPDLEQLTYHELTNVGQVVSWVAELDLTLPSEGTILSLLQKRSTIVAFEHLVPPDFTGRVTELNLIRDHIDSYAGSSSLKGQLDRWFKTSKKPVLAIHGPGGMGKSALIGKILLENYFKEKSNQIPFAYLTFDQETLKVDQPFTLLVEATSQFALQYPEHKSAFATFSQEVTRFRNVRGATAQRMVVHTTRHARVSDSRKVDEELYFAFVDLLKIISQKRTADTTVHCPVLLALDTFEEVQYRDRESLTVFWQMLDYLQKRFPTIRIVITGRAPVKELSRMEASLVNDVPLLELTMEDRVSLLRRLGITDRNLAQELCTKLGGNPLTLRLAANALKNSTTPLDSLSNVETKKWLFFQVDEQVIQGQLYRRILDHIKDERVRTLAHPGMVLRRTSPELILNVLAPICGITINSFAEATNLFSQLMKEHALVTMGETGLLFYRPEVRQAMIRLLIQDKYDLVRQLHRAAIQFYSQSTSVQDRAEEIYHRLALGEDDFAVLDSRWMDGIEQSIIANLEEFNDTIKVWLASRLNLEISRGAFLKADILDWERNIIRKAKKALSQGEVKLAFTLFNERTQRSTASPLFALEAKAYMLAENLPKAKAVIDRGIDDVLTSGNRGRLAELLWLRSQVLILERKPEAADEALSQAQLAVTNANNPTALIHILIHRLMLRQSFEKNKYQESSNALRVKLNTACQRLDSSTLYQQPFIIELAISFLDREFPETVKYLRPYVSQSYSMNPGMLTSENLRGLEEYRYDWEDEDKGYYQTLV
ncbi:MAG: hypothetical protein WD824_15820 [Cyclobacteriaceae bacterium]